MGDHSLKKILNALMCYLKALGAYDLNLKSTNRWDGVSLDPALCEINRMIHDSKLIKNQFTGKIAKSVQYTIKITKSH